MKYFALLTKLGENLLAQATALGTKIELTHMAVGDGGGSLPTPDTNQTKLIKEQRRAAINTLFIDEQNKNQIVAEQIIPEKDGGWWIREIGLFDKDGNLIAVANCPETYKPQLAEGSGRTQSIRMVLIVSHTESVTLKIDPSVVLATREFVNTEITVLDKKIDALSAQTKLDLTKKIDKASITHVKGNSTELVVSQQLLTTEIGKAQPKGNYLSVGDFGVGGTPAYLSVDKLMANEFSRGDKNHTSGAFSYWYGITLAWSGAEKTNAKCQIITGINNRDLYYRFATNATNALLEFGVAMKIYSDGNTTTDKNGFIRALGQATALTTSDVTQTVGSSKTAVMSQFAVVQALGDKQNTGNYLDKDSTGGQLLKAPLYAHGEIGAGNPRGTDAVLLLKTIGMSEPRLVSKLANDATWLNHSLPTVNGQLSLKNTASKDTSGYLLCGDTGVMIQWGEVPASLTETDYKKFPVPFRQGCFQIVATYAGFQDFGMGIAAYANSNKDFIVTSRTREAILKNGHVRYIAIGY